MNKEIKMSNMEMNIIYKHSTEGDTKIDFNPSEIFEYFQENAPFIENWLNSKMKSLKPEFVTDVNSLIKKCKEIQKLQVQLMENYCK